MPWKISALVLIGGTALRWALVTVPGIPGAPPTVPLLTTSRPLQK